MVSARQEITKRWWNVALTAFRCLVSDPVIEECAAGDSQAAADRMAIVSQLEVLEVSEACRNLAAKLIAQGAIPASEPRDALHVSIAAVHGAEFLVTWSFRHIANAALRNRIASICRSAGYEPPIICTPEELLGDDNGE